MNASKPERERLQREPERRGLLLTLILTGGFLLAEVAGSFLTNSLALLADAGHMLVDVAALGTSFMALSLAQRPSTRERTYGLLRLEILAALANGMTLLLITGYIAYEAYQRLRAPREIQSLGMLLVAAVGLGVNLTVLYVMRGGKSLNLRSAWLHVLGDTASSVGIIIGGLVILFTGWTVIDPLLSLGIALLILVSGYRVTLQAANILLEATPAHIDLSQLASSLRAVAGVVDVHDLHVWTVTSGLEAMSGHVVVQDSTDPASSQRILRELCQVLRDQFGIEHVTIQLETESLESDETFI